VLLCVLLFLALTVRQRVLDESRHLSSVSVQGDSSR
jgi:hypothetical protein